MSQQPADRILRHKAIDRAFHWITAVAVLVLLATGLLPVVGVEFPWVTIHWVTGVVLAAAVLFHIIRASFWQRLRCMWINARDLRPGKAAKYTLAQKLMHLALSVVVLVAVGTGLVMMAKIDTPLWKRDPYLLDASTWGVIYVLHGLAALAALTLIIIHIYFGLIPEKRMYLRAMVRGWVHRDELLAEHDPERWPGRRTS